MNELQKKMMALFTAVEAIRKKAEAEKREMTEDEVKTRQDTMAQIENLKKQLDSMEQEEKMRASMFGNSTGPESRNESVGSPATSPDAPIYRGTPASMLGAQLIDIQAASSGHDGAREARHRLEQNSRRAEELFSQRKEAAMRSGMGKETAAAATGGFTLQDGGYSLQGETVTDLMTHGFNNSEVLPRCAKRTLSPGTQFLEIIGIDETSRKNGSRGGGITVYTSAELNEYEKSKTAPNKVRIEPKKLTGLFYGSDEWKNNVTFMGQEIRSLFGEEFAFKTQDMVIRGSGAGVGLGILNSPALIVVPKEGGQTAATINTKNIVKMFARFSGRNPVWFINRDCHPALDELSVVAGTAALEPRFVTYGPDGILRIKGAPVIEIEQCSTLGTKGDLILADLSQYIVADRGGIDEAMSIHVGFIYGQNTWRFTYYFDGQPRWLSSVKPYQGTNEVSPFVVLETRS